MTDESRSLLKIATSLIALALFIGVNVFQACSQFSADSDSGLASVPQMRADASCRFIGVDIMQARLQNIFNIASGDVPVLDDYGNPTGQMRIASNLGTLGQAQNGLPADYSCSTPKLKVAVAVMVDACHIAVNDRVAETWLFPNGGADYSALYQSLIGRPPTADEISIIQSATSSMAGLQAEEAACAIVASSLEALIAI